MTRVHPYEYVFGTGVFESEMFPGIRDEAEIREVDARDRERFVMLETVGELMRSMLPPESETPATSQFAAIVHHAYQFWLAGKKTFAFDEATMIPLLREPHPIAGEPVTPVPAGYVQLPRNLIFARVAEDAQAEAADGFFFVVQTDPTSQSDRLDVLLVLGLLPNRAGFSVVEVGTDLAVEKDLANVAAREGGTDFDNVLPGGESRLFALTNQLEVIKLAARCFLSLGKSGG